MTLELLRPWVLLLLPLPILSARLLGPRAARRALVLPGDVWRHLEALSDGGRPNPLTARAPHLLRGLGWVALLVALAGPVRQGPELVRSSGRDVVLAVDVSASMGAPLGEGGARRLDLVLEALNVFFDAPAGDRLGLVAFGENAYLIAPPTFDTAAVHQMLGELEIGFAGRRTDLGQAIGLSLKTLRDGNATQHHIVLITDGEANTGALTAPDAAEIAKQDGVRLFLVGVSEEPDPARQAQLEDIARSTGGAFFPARSASDLAQVAAAVTAKAAPAPRKDRAETRRIDLTWAALIIALSVLAALIWREHRAA